MGDRKIIAVCLLYAFGAAGSRAVVLSAESEALDEVVVAGSQYELGRLRDELVELEVQFYDRFNELNTVDDFDTHCHLEARIGTLVKRRYCRAVFQDEAYAREGQEYAQYRFASESNPYPVAPGSPPLPAYVAMQARMEDYRDNMRKVVLRNPDLIELLRKRHDVEKQYETALRSAFGLSPGRTGPSIEGPADEAASEGAAKVAQCDDAPDSLCRGAE